MLLTVLKSTDMYKTVLDQTLVKYMVTDRPSIVFYRTAYGTMGGATKMFQRLLENINTSEFDITLVSQREDTVCRRAMELGIDTEIVPYPGVLDTYDGKLLEMSTHKKGVAALRLLQHNWMFREQVNKPDMVWCSGTRSFAMLLPYFNVTDVESIWNIGLLKESAGKMKYINEAILRTADYIFIESRKQAKRQLTRRQYNTHKDKFNIIHKGIDINKYNPKKVERSAKGDECHVGTAALINPRKGLEHFIEAASLIKETDIDSNIKFTIAGTTAREDDSRYKRQLKNLIQENGLEENVEFLGWVDDMPQYLHTLDVFILPSYNEGIPGVIREALAMKTPVIATDVGGVSEAVINGKNGFLVKPGDKDRIAEKTLYLLTNPTERKRMGERGRQHIINNFTIKSYVETYTSHFKQISSR